MPFYRGSTKLPFKLGYEYIITSHILYVDVISHPYLNPAVGLTNIKKLKAKRGPWKYQYAELNNNHFADDISIRSVSVWENIYDTNPLI